MRSPFPWSGYASLVGLTLLLEACGSDFISSSSSNPSGDFKGTMVGGQISGVLTLSFPTTVAAAQPGVSLVPIAQAGTITSAASITVTGVLAITGSGAVALDGTYDGTRNPQLTATGGGYTVTGSYFALVGLLAGGFTGPGGVGQWAVAAGGNAVKVFCGTFSGTSSGGWNLVLEGSSLFGVADLPGGAVQLQGLLSAGKVTIAFINGSATGTLDAGAGSGSGSWTDTGGGQSGTWTVNSNGC